MQLRPYRIVSLGWYVFRSIGFAGSAVGVARLAPPSVPVRRRAVGETERRDGVEVGTWDSAQTELEDIRYT